MEKDEDRVLTFEKETNFSTGKLWFGNLIHLMKNITSKNSRNFVLSALAVEKTANLSLRTTLDKLAAEEDSEFTRSRQLLDVNTWRRAC